MATYKHAIEWIAMNDDTEWLKAKNDAPSVTACLVADLFGKNDEQVKADLKLALKRVSQQNSTTGEFVYSSR